MRGIDWLPDQARAAGLDVYVMPGFETRSTTAAGLTTIHGVVWHHTATGPNWSDRDVAALLRDGRRDLPGPLSQIGVERDGTAVFVAAGRANHNGYGEWGNSSVGIEFYSDGVNERLTDAQIRTGIILTALILKHEGLPASRTKAHRETDPRRKIDPLIPPSMDDIRNRVHEALTAPIEEDDDDMAAPYSLWRNDGETTVWRVDAGGQSRVRVPNPTALSLDQFFLAVGKHRSDVVVVKPGEPGHAWLNGIPIAPPATPPTTAQIATAVKNAIGTVTSSGPATITEADLAKIAKAVNDELHRRVAG